MSEKKIYKMFYPGTNADGKSTFVEHRLDEATDREMAKKMAMGVVRVLDIKNMHIVEDPGELVFYSFPMGKNG